MLQIALGGLLGLGWGIVPRLGMPGVALGQILAQALGAACLFWYLRSGRGRLRLVFGGVPIRRELFGDILKVGAVACLSPLQSVRRCCLMAGFVAQLGVLPLAGFAIGQRLEFLTTTVAFGIGVAVGADGRHGHRRRQRGTRAPCRLDGGRSQRVDAGCGGSGGGAVSGPVGGDLHARRAGAGATAANSCAGPARPSPSSAPG